MIQPPGSIQTCHDVSCLLDPFSATIQAAWGRTTSGEGLTTGKSSSMARDQFYPLFLENGLQQNTSFPIWFHLLRIHFSVASLEQNANLGAQKSPWCLVPIPAAVSHPSMSIMGVESTGMEDSLLLWLRSLICGKSAWLPSLSCLGKKDSAAQKGPYKLLENNWKTQANGIPGWAICVAICVPQKSQCFKTTMPNIMKDMKVLWARVLDSGGYVQPTPQDIHQLRIIISSRGL